MQLNLNKDIIFFDIESTGLNVIRDRIIQLAMIKHFADGREPDERNYLINPGVPISEEAMQVHGITAADVARKPTFQQVAKEIFEYIGDCDLAGYRSNQFDLPMIMEELARYGYELDMDNRRCVDVQRIFYKMEPRTLAAAHKFYCGAEMEGAHDALSDVRATVAVLDGQLKMYEGVDYVDTDGARIETPVQPKVSALHEFTNDARMIDATQRLKYDHNGVVVFNFGKYLGKPVAKTLYEDRPYFHWMMNKEFSYQVKQQIKKLLSDYEKQMQS